MADANEKSHAHTASDSENFSTADTRTPSLTTSTKDEISSKDSQQISSATHHNQHESSELPADYDLQITNPEDLERDAPDTITHTKSRTSIFSRRSSKKPKEGLVHDSLPLTNLEEGIVGWDSQDDPAMPLNFPVSRKFGLMGLVAVMTFVAPLASSMFAPGVGYMAADFHNTNVLLDSFVVSVFLLGFAFGPLVLSPMSEIFGRRPVLDVANAFFVVWQIGCALAPNLGSLIGFRFLAGLGGSGCITLGSGVISDLFYPDQRGAASAIYALGPLIGPVVGPVCGGFIAQRIGWRWVFWIILIASAPVTIAIFILNRETNHQVLIRRKTERLSKELGRTDLRSCYTPKDAPARTPSQIISQGLVRPFKMLFKSPIVFILALYMSFVYGLLYLLFTTITQVFQETYHWPVDICGLAYLGVGIGFFLGIAVVGKTSDKSVIAQTKKNNGVFVPEMRLPSMMVFACFVPISFFWYGWSADKHAFWIVPIIGMVPFGFGMMGIFVPIQTYVIDCFPMYAASGNAALTATRSLVGGLLPLAGPTMYDKLGLGWGNSLLGFLAVAMIPVPALIYKYGGVVRTKYPVKL